MRYLIFLTALAGCASPTFRDPSGVKSQTDFKRDKVDCQVKARQSGKPNGPMIFGESSQDVFNDCMEGQGWTLEK